jgi:hypothetical protein
LKDFETARLTNVCPKNTALLFCPWHNQFGILLVCWQRFFLGSARDRMVKLTPSEVTALKELAAAGSRGRKSRAVRRDLARLIRAHYVTEESASMDTVVYVITDHGRRALAN